jgi:hypothetical protein
MMGRCPFGGQTWLYLNWLRGLAANGHEVWYVEDDTVWPYDPERNAVTDDSRYAVRHVGSCMERIGLGGMWAYRLADRAGACWGMASAELDELYRSCDALLNVVGATELREAHRAARYRVYVETDPVTAELRLDGGDSQTAAAYADHHAVVTYGENYGAADCGVPLCGIDFRKTRQPIDLELWPMAFDPAARNFTTIGNYRQEGSDVAWRGETYRWSKHHEWERLMDLPSRTRQPFELAMQCTADDRRRLGAAGWRVVPPLKMSLDVFGRYPEYFRRSRAELTVAKDQNVRLRSGWFSERDACYLATGKPVVSQDTGFSNVLPTGAGLFAFKTADEALAAVDAINSDYRRHCEAARGLAEEYFDARKVAGRMLADLGLG